MNEENWKNWVLQTARAWEDIEPLIKRSNVEIVDADHKEWVEDSLEINKIIAKMENEKITFSTITKEGYILEQLRDFTREHFRKEEMLIKSFGLDGITIQQHQHALIIEKIDKIMENFQTGKATITVKTKVDLLKLVVNHINNIDALVFNIEEFFTFFTTVKEWESIEHIIQTTGVPAIDKDHKSIISLVLKLFSQIATDFDEEEVLKTFKQLDKTVIKHFKRETQFIKSHMPKMLVMQNEEHQYFTKMMSKTEKMITAGKVAKLKVRKNVVLSWWANHINQADYYTFGLKHWVSNLCEEATSAEEVSWLMKRTPFDIVNRQHDNIIEHAVTLALAIEKGRTPHDKLLSFFALFEHKILKHFEREEELMKKYDLTEEQIHLNDHKQFIGYLENYKKMLINKCVESPILMKTEILVWWINHINFVDYSTFMKLRKVKAVNDGQ